MISIKIRDVLAVYSRHNTSLARSARCASTSIRFRSLGVRRAFTSITIGFPVAMPNGPLAACLGSYPSADLIVRAFQSDNIDRHSLAGTSASCRLAMRDARTRRIAFKAPTEKHWKGTTFYENWKDRVIYT